MCSVPRVAWAGVRIALLQERCQYLSQAWHPVMLLEAEFRSFQYVFSCNVVASLGQSERCAEVSRTSSWRCGSSSPVCKTAAQTAKSVVRLNRLSWPLTLSFAVCRLNCVFWMFDTALQPLRLALFAFYCNKNDLHCMQQPSSGKCACSRTSRGQYTPP